MLTGSPNFGSWKGAISSAESLAPGPSADPSDYLVLAAHRTKRPDILTAFKPYIGGWNITNNLLGSAPGFILAAVWIWSFGSLLVVPLLQIESTRESQGIIIQFKKNLPNFTDSLYLCYCVIISNLPIRIHSLVVVVVPEIELHTASAKVLLKADIIYFFDVRTKRPDILTAFKPYIGGWNITNNLLGSAPGFILAAVWILSFGSLLVVPLLQMESTRESQGIIQFKKNLPHFTDSLYLCYCVIISNLPIRIHSLVVVVVPEIELNLCDDCEKERRRNLFDE
ncbi:hypothetical protein F2Q70_00031154 [Brassica cretica]|uniref:Uncharacterized protein n=1 Tax=Brassica cretica TaxID=69181 RepID=A0A8S9FBZ8_BRACR|nr:hypothetical protein F2Q70_00031154 [Brassica cretica]